MPIRFFLTLAAVLVLAAPCAATPLSASARAEIDGLLAKLQGSGCEFNRNGTWYSGTEAKIHLLRKLDYLEGKNLVQTTEKFVELGASVSSSSGKPYLVRCGSGTPQESNKWLMQELKSIRATWSPPASGAK